MTLPAVAWKYGDLLSHHRAELQKSGLTDETIKAAGIYSESKPDALGAILGWQYPPKKLVPAIIFPYTDANGQNGYCRAKPDRPRSHDRKKVKYESPKGRPNQIYLPPGVADTLQNAHGELLITEGEKKALAANQAGFPCIGLVGVYGWKRKKAERLLPALEEIVWRGRQVRIVFDSDIVRKDEVKDAEARLAKLLADQGAIVRCARLPDGPPGPDGNPTKMGADDFLVAHGASEFRKLLDAAQESEAIDPDVTKKDAGGLDPATEAKNYLETGMADDLYRLRFWRGSFHLWTKGRYADVPTSEIRGYLIRHLNEGFTRLTMGVTGNVLDQVKAQSLLPSRIEAPAWIEGNGDWPPNEILVTRNGMIHLPTFASGDGYLKPLTPRFFTPVALDYPFDAAAPEPTQWLDFLSRLWPDDPQSIETLQAWLGYLLTPDTSHHKILLTVGPPRSGKGTIARVTRALVGEANVAGPTLASLGTNFGLWPLIGKTVAIISDARLSGRTDSAIVVERLLSISGEDALTIDRKNLEPLTCRLLSRLMIFTNELPRLGDSSGALANRFIVLRLTQSYLGHEDIALTSKLLAELPGILLWAIAGWKQLRERGCFDQPEAASELIDDLNDLSSPVGQFVRECCVFGPHQARVDDLFAAWLKWCEHVGRKEPGTQQVFGRDLLAAFPTLKRVRPRENGERVRAYEGIAVKSGW